MGNKKIIFDCGELGWSLYLSAYALWLVLREGSEVLVYTYADRVALFERFDNRVKVFPKHILKMFEGKAQDCTSFRGCSDAWMRSVLSRLVEDGYEIPTEFKFGCNWFFRKKAIYMPYRSSDGYDKRKRILVFPRYRTSEEHAYRNLPKEFYEKLIETLCIRYPDILITACGKPVGGYEIKMPYNNFENMVSEHTTIQNLIDLCASAIFAIGGTSAPPKISLLQRVPTYIIGHEKQRFTVDENWSNTKVWFQEINATDYQKIDINQSINQITEAISCL